MTQGAENPRRIAIGMSGGLDSSVAAALLVDQGWDVTGLSLHMFKEGSRCCSIEDVNRARRVCEQLGIRHYVMNVVDEFREAVIRPFTDAYASGRTPNPCIYCNRDFKFGVLLKRAQQLGCTHMATGHYARVEARADGWHLLRGVDRSKDQSYFLHRLGQDVLRSIVFPLGGLRKAEVRALATDRRLPIEGARETADLCFITSKGPAPLVESMHPLLARGGSILSEDGRVLGRHRGIHRYTVGQRGGLGIAVGHPLYVRRIDAAQQAVVVAPRERMRDGGCRVRDVFWTTPTPPAGPIFEATVRIRYGSAGTLATLVAAGPSTYEVRFAEPQFAAAPGQAAVFYREDEVLGGGWIETEPDGAVL